MNFVVCCKRVPVTTAPIRVGADGKSINWEGVEAIISPYDEIALECALRMKEKAAFGEITALCVDPDGNSKITEKALVLGADKAVLLKGGTNFDGYAIAQIIAAQLKTMTFDIAFFGKQATDDDGCSVPSMVAHLLGLPRVNVCVGLEIDGNVAKCRRQVEGGEELVEIPLPCVISAQKGLNGVQEARLPSIKGIMSAKKKPTDQKPAGAFEQTVEILKMEPPPERPAGRIVGQGKDAVKELVRLLREEAKVL